MPENALVQTRINTVLKDRATAVLSDMGLTVSEVMRMLLTHIANKGAFPPALLMDPAAHDAWFKAKVWEAINDPRSAVPHDEVEARFAKRRASTNQVLGEDEA